MIRRWWNSIDDLDQWLLSSVAYLIVFGAFFPALAGLLWVLT